MSRLQQANTFRGGENYGQLSHMVWPPLGSIQSLTLPEDVMLGVLAGVDPDLLRGQNEK